MAPRSEKKSSKQAQATNNPEPFYKPYLELMRIEKPIGVANFYFPFLFGSLLGAILRPTAVAPSELLSLNAILLVEAFLIRGLLCTWNDIIDQDLDAQVARTRNRPLPRGAVSTPAACVFCVAQIFASAGPFLLLSREVALCAVPSLVLHTFYPLAKRVTNYPQLVLGLAKAGGAVIALPAIGVSVRPIDELDTKTASLALLCVAIVSWVTIWDTIYSAQDLADDKKAGIKSTMVAHEAHAKWFLRAIAALKLSCLAALGVALRRVAPDASTAFLATFALGSVPVLVTMIEDVELQRVESCVWWFSKGNLLVGLATGAALTSAWVAKEGMVPRWIIGS